MNLRGGTGLRRLRLGRWWGTCRLLLHTVCVKHNVTWITCPSQINLVSRRGSVTSRYRVVRMADGAADSRPDTLSAEEPLEIREAGRQLTLTMRTPGATINLTR